MADLDTIDISHDSIVVLKHHGSYMQQDRDFQVRNKYNGMTADKAKYAQSYQVRGPDPQPSRLHAKRFRFAYMRQIQIFPNAPA